MGRIYQKMVGLFFLFLGDIINKLSIKASRYSYKYSKITPQKKFHLLSLVLRQKMLIKDVLLVLIKAAKIVDINYSTAKTILFFHRNGDKSYQF